MPEKKTSVAKQEKPLLLASACTGGFRIDFSNERHEFFTS